MLIKKQNILKIILLLLLVSVIGGTILFTSGKRSNTIDYQEASLENFDENFSGNYILNRNYFVKNSLQVVQDSKSNIAYRSNKIPSNVFENFAKKLGLGNKSYNSQEKLYVWNNEGDQDSLLQYDEGRMFARLRYYNGINSDIVEVDNSYNYIANLLEVELIDSIRIKADTYNNLTTISFTGSYNGKKVYSSEAQGVHSVIQMLNGKIISFDMYLIPNNLAEFGTLRPITNVGEVNIENIYHSVLPETEVIQAGSSDAKGTGSGYLKGPNGKISIVMKSYSPCYYFYVDPENNNTYLLPALDIKGEYIDEKSDKGGVTMVVVNQDSGNNV